MNQAPTLTGKRLILRRPLERDIEDRFRCGGHPEILRMYGGDTRNMKPYLRQDALRWYQGVLSNPLEWVIEFEGACIGNVRLTVNEQDKQARFAIGIFDVDRLGIGLGTEATRLVLEYAFGTPGLHRVDLRVLEYNKRAVRCYEKCGFIREGMEREGVLVEGKWETDLMMSILEQEYRSKESTGG